MIVCFDIQLNVAGEAQYSVSSKEYVLEKPSAARWRIGSCSSLNSIEGPTLNAYKYPAIYTDRCCLEAGRHSLVCYNNPPARGWKNTYLLINGHRYCDDFNGYKSFQKILVKGTNVRTRQVKICHFLKFSKIFLPINILYP